MRKRHGQRRIGASRRSATNIARAISKTYINRVWVPEELERRVLLSASVQALPALSQISNLTATPPFIIYHAGASPDASSAPSGVTPTTMRHAYGMDVTSFGSTAGNGSGQTIAIVDAYDQPNIASDLAAFDSYYGLTAPPSFTKLNETGGTTPPSAASIGGWGVEISLDVEWAHVMAPNASIDLIEANSASYSDLLTAENTARNLAGVCAVSNSWSGAEFSGDSSYDTYFTTPSGHGGVTFLAATGDDGAEVGYPAVSPNVVAVGGTTLTTSSGNYASESGWSGSGGGISVYTAQPTYQNGVVTQSSTMRTVPDVAMDADPNSGVPVYDTYDFGSSTPWEQIGGTSLATPLWAGVIAVVDQGRVLDGLSSLDGFSQTLPGLYKLPQSDFHDITTGSNGYAAGAGYDLVTGRGTPIINVLAPALADQATHVTFTQQPTSTTAGQIISPAVTVAVQDANGATITSDNSTVTLTLSSGVFATTGTSSISVAAVNGVATFSNLKINAAGNYTITASDALLTTAVSNSFTISAATASKLAFTTQPTSAAPAGSTIGTVTVAVEDTYGNIITSNNSNVTLALIGGVFSTGSDIVTATAVNGVATFSNLVINSPGSYTLSASDGTLISATSSTFSVYGAAAEVGFIQQPTNTLPHQAISPAVTVAVQDASGITVANDSSAVTLTLSSGTFSTGSNSITVNAVNGIATFSNLIINAIGTYTLTASDGSLNSATSGSFVVAVGPAAKLAFAPQPPNATAGQPVAAFAVNVTDAGGNLVTADGSTVTLTLSSGIFASTGTRTATATAVNGVATFNTLVIDTAGNYTLTASDGSLSGATSGSFTITPAAASKVAFTQQPTSVNVGTPITPAVTVTVEDQFGNTVVSDASTVTLTLSSGTFSTGSNAVSATAVSGIATFGNLIINNGGTYTLSASDSSLTAATSNSFQVTVTPAVLSINRYNPPGASTEATSVTYAVTFNEPMTGVTASNFQLVLGSGLTASSTLVVSPTSGYSSVYTITISSIVGHGTLGLNMVNGTGLSDAAGDHFPAASNGTFQAQQTYAGLSYPYGATVADVNGDGKADLIVAGFSNNCIGVLLGNGDGTFKAMQTYATGVEPHSVVAADLNGDGKLDLIVPNESSDTISVLFGNGDGTFQTQQTYALGTSPTYVAVADVNGDGKPDMIVTNGGANTVSVFLGNGNGTFQAPQTYAAGDGPWSVVATDVNGDGKLDLVDADLNGDTIGIMLGNGNGTFQAAQTYASGSVDPGCVVTGDFNGDGKTDVAVTGRDTSIIGVLFGNGNGTFQPVQTFATGADTYWASAVDFNSDGHLDLAVANDGSSTISVLLGNGNGTFQTQATYAVAPDPMYIATADVNGDGALDLVTFNSGTTISVLLGNTGFTPIVGQTYTIDQPTHLTLTQPPTSTGAGQIIDPSTGIQVAVQDSSGSTVAIDSSTVTLTLNGGVFSTGSNTVTATSVNGIATFSGLVINASGNYTITASDGSLTSATSSTFTIYGTSAQLGFIQQPGNTLLGQSISPAVTVAVQDSNGNTVGNDSSPVTLTLSNGTFSTGSNSVTVNAVNGIATFSNLIINTAGTYTLTATDGTLNSATSSTFAVAIGAAAKLAFVQQPPSATAGQPIGSFALKVTDAAGNIVVNDGSTVTLTLSSGIFASTGSKTATAVAVNGVATFNTLVIDTAGNYTITASDGTLTGATSGSFTISPAAAVQLAFSQQPSNTKAGNAISPAVTVAVEDTYGNVVTSDGSTVILTLSSGTFSTGSNAVSATAVNGIATFSNLIINSTGTYTLSASDGALSGAASSSFTITVTPAVLSLTRDIPSSASTEATSVIYAITFNEPLTGVSASNFQLVLGSGLTAGSTLVVSPASGYNSVYTITVNSISGKGTLGLNMINGTGITDSAGNHFPSISNGTFQPQQTYIAPTYSSSLLTADINGDGKVDLVEAGWGSNDLAIFLGNGDGTFKPMVTYATGTGPGCITVADINGDGKLDLIVANSSGDTLSVLLGNGSGTFQPQTTIGLGTSVGGVIAGDFNGDGKVDLAVTENNLNAVAVLLGNGNGTFRAPQTFAAGTTAVPLFASDFNGDGKLDLAVGDDGGGTVGVLLGNGDGTFAAVKTFLAGTSSATDLVIADFNGDGKPDLAVSGNHNYIDVLQGNGDGTFQAAQTYATGAGGISITAGDFNGDGKPDLVVTDSTSNTVSVLLNNGNGTFQPQITYATSTQPESVATADLNADGTLDLAVSDYGPTPSSYGLLSVLLGNTGFTPIVGQTYTIDQPTHLTLTQPPTSTGTGQVIDPSTGIQVAVQDASGSTVSIDNSTVTLTLNGGVFSTGSNTVTATAVNGIATFGGLVINASGNYTITASDGSLTSATSSTFSIYGTAAQLGFIQQPGNTLIGQPISPAVTVAVQDSNGNTVGNDSSPVTLTLSNGTFSTGSNSVTVNAVNGIATFSNLIINTAGTYTLTATDGTLNSATSSTFAVAIGAAAKLAFVQQPPSATAGQPIGSFALKVTDAAGNIEVNDGSTVTLTLSSGIFASTGSKTATAVAVNGVATFNTLVIDTAGNYTITASDGTLTGATSGSFTISPAAAVQLAFSQQPSNTKAGNAISPAVTVAVEDTYGNTVTSNGSTVTLTLSSGTFASGGSTVSTTAVNGVATFNNLIINTPGTYTLIAGDGSLSSATSNSFYVTTTPAVLSINRYNPPGASTEATSVTYAITFNEPLTGVSASNFQLVLGSGLTASSTLVVSPTSGYNSVYIITVNSISGKGTLGLNMVNGTGISDAAGDHFPAASNGTFQAQQTYTVGSNPYYAIPTDVNGDGKLDLVVSNGSSGTVSVLLGNGDGTFQAQRTFAAGSAPYPLAAADINNDGKIDLVVANESGVAGVLMGNGDGTFQAPRTFTCPEGYTGCLELIDLNGDGKLDLVAGADLASATTVFLGNGDGTFQAPRTFADGSGPYVTAAADLNGDGKLDLVNVDWNGSSVATLLGNGDGTFQAPMTFAVSTNPDGLAVGDLNGDGKLDLVVANRGSNYLSILLGNGNGTFKPQQTVAISIAAYSLAMADLNGDGKLDVVTTDRGNNAMGVLLGNGDGTFQAEKTYAVGYTPWGVTLADLNGDGSLDAITANEGGTTVSVLLGNTGFTPFVGQTYTVDQPTHLTLTQPPTSSGVGQIIKPSTGIQVAVQDSSGSTVSIDNSTVTLTLNGGVFSTGSNTVTATAVNGIATFTGLVINATGNYTITASDGALTSATSSPFTIYGTAAQLGLIQQPGNTLLGQAISPAVTVAVQDGNGNTVLTDSSPVTLTLSSGTFSTGSNSVTVNAVNGIATFSNLIINTAGTYTLTASDGTLNNATSSTFTVAIGPAAKLVFAQQPPSTTAGQTIGAFSVDVTDSVGNIVVNDGSTITLTLSSGIFASTGSKTATAVAVNGVATFNTLIIDTAGNYTITASDGTLTGATSGSFTISPAAPAQLAFIQQPSNTKTGNAISPAVTVAIEDTYGNTVVANASTVTLLLSSGTFSTGSATVSITAVNGIATFSNLIINTTGTYSLSASDGSLTGATSSSFYVTTTPAVLSMNRYNPPGASTEATSVTYAVTFNEPLTGVTASNFQDVLGTGLTASSTIVVWPTSGYNTLYTITINSIVGKGTLGLNMVNGTGIADATGDTFAAAAGTFKPQQTYGGLPSPQGAALADLNGDGKLDLAEIGSNGRFGVFMGNGDGTFKPMATYAATTTPCTIAVADINGDGKPDVIVGDATNVDELGIFLGNGDGTFQAMRTVAVTGNTTRILPVDINGDGKPDLVLANDDQHVWGVMLGNGDGTFKAERTYASSDPMSVLVGDFNGDGKLDAVTCNYSVSTIGIQLGNGDGTFAAMQTFASGNSYTWQIAGGDFNGDGNLDVVLAGTSSSSLSVMLGNGNGTFQTPRTYALSAGSKWVSVADLNGDGKLDLVAADSNSNVISVLLGNGDGTFKPQQTYTVQSNPWTVLIGDLNGDGAPDLVSANSNSTVSVLLGNTGFTPFVGQTYTIDQPTRLTLTQPPTTTSAGQIINPSTGIQVAVQDSSGSTLSIDSSTVTLTLNGGVFSTGSNTVTATAVNGIATFSGLIINTVGSYTLTASDGTLSSVTSSSFTITQGTPTITWATPAPITYGTALNGTELDATASVPGTFAYNPAAPTILHSGTQRLLVTFTPTDTTDYTTATANVNLQVNQAPLTITANNQSTVYGTALPQLTASYSGFVNGDTSASLSTQPTLTTTATAASHVAGSPYTITASGAADPDYNISYVAGSLAVTPAPLTIIANNQSTVYGAALPTLTASYSGFVNGDTSASLTTQPALSTTATAASPVVGSPYSITASNAADPDYDISYVNGALTVNTASSTITLTSSNASPTYGQMVTFTATITPNVGAGPTGTVQFQIDGGSVGTPVALTGNTAIYATSSLSPGSHSIVAVYNGDSNFSGGTSNTFTQTISATPSWASLSTGASVTWDSSSDTLTVTSGTLTITADPDPAEDSSDPTIIANGSSAHVEVQLADPSGHGDLIHVAGIELQNGATMDVASLGNAKRTHGNHEVLVVGALNASSAPLFSIASISKMDLEDNDMIVHDGNFDAIQALAFTGRHGTTGGFLDGTWTGNGLTSSVAAAEAAENGQEVTALAVVNNGDLPLGRYSSWSVGSVSEALRSDGNDVIVKYTYIGDWTLQGEVGQSAGVIFSGDYGTTPANFDGANGDDAWATGSYNGLSMIGQADGVVFSGYYGSGMIGNANTLGGADANALL